MMNLEFELKEALHKNVSLPALIELLCRYKQIGGGQKEAYAILEKIRDTDIEDAAEDQVLELMDFVSGFCSQGKRIWDEVLLNG